MSLLLRWSDRVCCLGLGLFGVDGLLQGGQPLKLHSLGCLLRFGLFGDRLLLFLRHLDCAGLIGDLLGLTGFEEPVTHHAFAVAPVGSGQLVILGHADRAQVPLGRFGIGLDTHPVLGLGPPDDEHRSLRHLGIVEELARLILPGVRTPFHLVVGLGRGVVRLAVLAQDGKCHIPGLLLLPAVKQVVEVEREVPHGVAADRHTTTELCAELLLRTADEPTHKVETAVILPFAGLEVGVNEDAELAGVEGGLIVGHGELRISTDEWNVTGGI